MSERTPYLRLAATIRARKGADPETSLDCETARTRTQEAAAEIR